MVTPLRRSVWGILYYGPIHDVKYSTEFSLCIHLEGRREGGIAPMTQGLGCVIIEEFYHFNGRKCSELYVKLISRA